MRVNQIEVRMRNDQHRQHLAPVRAVVAFCCIIVVCSVAKAQSTATFVGAITRTDGAYGSPSEVVLATEQGKVLRRVPVSTHGTFVVAGVLPAPRYALSVVVKETGAIFPGEVLDVRAGNMIRVIGLAPRWPCSDVHWTAIDEPLMAGVKFGAGHHTGPLHLCE